MVALAVVAFRDGGVAAVGAVTAARMATAALLAPFLATMADRVRRERVLAWVGVVRAATLGCAAVVTAAGGPAGGDVWLRRRRHGRHDAVPTGALGAAARAGEVSAGADERECGSRHAGLARHARRPGCRGRPACGERTGRGLRRVRRCVAVGRSGRRRAPVRRAAASGRPPAAAAARCSRASPPSRRDRTLGADHGARGRADVHARLPDRVRRRGRDRPPRHGRCGRRCPECGRRRRWRARLDLGVRAGPTWWARQLVRRRHRAVRRAAGPDRRRARAGSGDRPARPGRHRQRADRRRRLHDCWPGWRTRPSSRACSRASRRSSRSGSRPAACSRRWSSSCSAFASRSSRSASWRRWPWLPAGPRCAGSMHGCAYGMRTSRSCVESACCGALPAATIEQLGAGLEHAEFVPRQTVFEQGERGERFYVVESGRAEVVLDGHVVETLGRGELLRRDRPVARPAAIGHRSRIRGREHARERPAAQHVPDRGDRIPRQLGCEAKRS